MVHPWLVCRRPDPGNGTHARPDHRMTGMDWVYVVGWAAAFLVVAYVVAMFMKYRD